MGFSGPLLSLYFYSRLAADVTLLTKLQYCFDLLINCTKNLSKLEAFTAGFLKLRFVLTNSFIQTIHSKKVSGCLE